jgi:hypothetical protein
MLSRMAHLFCLCSLNATEPQRPMTPNLTIPTETPDQRLDRQPAILREVTLLSGRLSRHDRRALAKRLRTTRG